MRRDKSPTGNLEESEISKKKSPFRKNGKSPSLLPHVFIIAAVTLAAIAAAVFLEQKAHREITRSATEQFNRQQLILARSAAAGIETFIAEIDDDAQSLSDFPVVQKMEPGMLERMEVLYKGIPLQTSSRRLDKNGVLRFIYPNEGWRKNLVEQDYSREAWFKKAKGTGRVVISGLIINEAGDRRIRVARPVYIENEKGDREFNGVIVCSFDPKTLAGLFISPIISGETGYAWLLDEQGIFLAHHEERFENRDAFKARMEANPDLPCDAINDIQRQMMAGEEGTTRYVSGWHRGHKGKIEKLVAYTPVHVFGKIWSAAVCAPAGEVERITDEAHRSHLYTLGFIILILVAGGVLFFIACYRWAQSLQREIKIQKQAEKRIKRLNSILKAIRNVNQLIVTEKDRDNLLRKACDIMVEARGYDAAWLGFSRDGETFATVKGAGFRLEDVYRFSEHVMGDDHPPCIRRAISRKEKIIIADKSRECGDCFFKDACAGKEAAIIRVEHADRFYGLLAILFAPDVTVDEEERDLLREVAGDTALALNNMELEEKHKLAEEQLREYSENLEGMVEERSKKLKRALYDAEEARNKIDGILKSVSDGLIVTDTYSRVALMNRAAEDLLGVRFSEVIDHPVDFAIQDDETLRDRFKTTLQKREPGYQFDFELPGEDPKSPRIMRGRTSVIHDQEGEKIGIVTIIHDVTHEREMDRMKTEFISTAAHELRTPLTSIQGFSEILITRENVTEEERKKFLSYINEQAVTLAGVVSDLLDISRIESGRGFTLNKVRYYEVGEAIKRAILHFQDISPKHRFEAVLPDKPLELFIDKEKMEQAFNNILGNAVKYSPEGGVIRVVGEVVGDDGARS